MEFITLEHTDPDELVTAFNRSFSDYIVPAQLTRQQMDEKITVDRIQLGLSAAVMDSGKLIGFILHGYDVIDGRKTIYNAATGVIPEKRGRKLTRQLYDFILPRLAKANIDYCLLEVIEGNLPAIRTYTSIGFRVARELECYKGSVSPNSPGNGLEVHEITNLDWELLRSFWDWTPTWQNATAAVELSLDKTTVIGLSEDGQLSGYAAYNPATGRILQFVIKKQCRRKGYATKLFQYMSVETGKDLSMINIDNGSAGTAGFLRSIGLKPFIKQFEMELVF